MRTLLLASLILMTKSVLAQIYPVSSDLIHIEEGKYENRDHFVIKTPSATYYYDKYGGGFSRMIDRDGKDWIDFKMQPWDQYPASAAAAYRGIPNLVYGSDDSGAGHPGHDKCTTIQINDHALHTKSYSGKWEWEWSFHKQYARLRILKTDSDHPYWFLYEGIPGGKFDPPNQYYGHDQGGPYFHMPDYFQGQKIFENWEWFYCGAKQIGVSLFIVQLKKDNFTDTFSYLGNSESGIQSADGMVVFGFGRAEGVKPLINIAQEFIIGFFDKEIDSKENHQELESYITNIIR